MENEFKSFLKTVGGGEGDRCLYPTRLDLYGKGCEHNCSYCLDGDTLILMYDSTYKRLRDINIGDEVYGVIKRGTYFYYCKSIVLNKWQTNKPSHKITLNNDVELICSADHKWLTSSRGWKHTIGAMGGKFQRPHLTTNSKLCGLGIPIDPDNFKDTILYKQGYVCGAIRGDGTIGKYNYTGKRRKIDIQNKFRFVVKDANIVNRFAQYLTDLGITFHEFYFPMKDRKTQEIIQVKGVRSSTITNYDLMKDIMVNPANNSEFLRGFTAGIYDTEGSTDVYIKRIYNTDTAIIEIVEKALKMYDFIYVFDKDRTTITRKILKTIRIMGGTMEFLRFANIFNVAAKSKFNFDGVALKNRLDLRVRSIEPYSDNQELYDITTTTENFLANGVVSHNCYAKSLLDFRKLWNENNPAAADIEKVYKAIDKLAKDGFKGALRLGGMTDCFQPKKEHKYHNTYNAIKYLNEKGIHYLIVTKSALVADDEYIKIYDKKLAHIQISITSTHDDLSWEYEKADFVSRRIEALEKLYYSGFDVALRLSPFIPEFFNFKELNQIKCEKVIVEFLRVNTWIKRWFDIDFSSYTVKSGGYMHLPLATKIEVLKRLKFSQMSVCEDVPEHYEYFKENFNCNKIDCCNLNISR